MKISFALGCSAIGKSFTRQKDLTYAGPDFDSVEFGSKNSIRYLIDDYILTKDFDRGLKEASILSYAPEATRPIYIFTLKYDSYVPPLNSNNFVNGKKGNKNIESLTYDNEKYRRCPVWSWRSGPDGYPVDHLDAEIAANVFAFAFIERQ